MNNRQNLFGQGPRGGREQKQQPGGYNRPPPPRDDTPMAGYEDPRGGYGAPRESYGAPMPSRPAVGRPAPPQSQGREVRLQIAKIEGNNTLASQYIFENLQVPIEPIAKKKYGHN